MDILCNFQCSAILNITSSSLNYLERIRYLTVLNTDLTPLSLPPLTAPSGQDERVYDQTGLPTAHPHPARPCNPQAAVLDP